MFSKISRYRKVPDVTAPDAKGRVLAAKDLRLLPDVTGTFRHTVNAGDRLDQLGYKYYDQPLQWWTICDANPDFLSPLALLGREPVVTTRFPVTIAGAPPWTALFHAMQGMLGVEEVRIAEDVELVPQQSTVGGQTVTTSNEQFSRAVLITYNRLNVTAETLAAGIEAVGFQVASFADFDQVGQQIIIPPKPIG
jgi:hypothetical protein